MTYGASLTYGELVFSDALLDKTSQLYTDMEDDTCMKVRNAIYITTTTIIFSLVKKLVVSN